MNNSLSSTSTASTSSSTVSSSVITLESKQSKERQHDFEFDKQEVRELREEELNGESEDELIFVNFERKFNNNPREEYYSSSDSSFEKFESNSTISPIYEEDEEDEEIVESENNKDHNENNRNIILNFKCFDEDIIPFHDFEYEKIAPSSPAKSLTPTFKTKTSSNYKQMSRLLSNMNQYYSLTDISNYHLDDESYNNKNNTDDQSESDASDHQKPLTHVDIGYSSDNERIESPEANNKKKINCEANAEKHNFYMTKHRKSYSDYYMSSTCKKRKQHEMFSKYKKFFSRYSRTKIGNSDDDYIADEDEFENEDGADAVVSTSSSSASTESGLLNQYRIPSFKKTRARRFENYEKKQHLSNTTSAYDTSSNLSNEGYFNNIYKEFQNSEFNFQNQNGGESHIYEILKRKIFLKFF